MGDSPRIPIGIISGYLGSGKTTRLRRLLQDSRFARSAVIVNEFGVIGIDHQLLESGDDQTILLANGCICCSARSGLETALRDLWMRNSLGEVDLDRVIIETSGLADPLAVAYLFSPGGPLYGLYARQRLVVTVDAGVGQSTIESDDVARQQVMFADAIKVTKRDRHEASLPLQRLIRSLNPDADVDLSIASDITFEDLFRPRDDYRTVREPRTSLLRVRTATDHLDCVNAIGLVADEPLSGAVLSGLLEGLSANAGTKLLRIKGIVNLAGCSHPVLVQGVSHQRAEITALAKWPSGDQRTRLSIIGRGVPEQWPRLLLAMLQRELAALGHREHPVPARNLTASTA